MTKTDPAMIDPYGNPGPFVRRCHVGAELGLKVDAFDAEEDGVALKEDGVESAETRAEPSIDLVGLT